MVDAHLSARLACSVLSSCCCCCCLMEYLHLITCAQYGILRLCTVRPAGGKETPSQRKNKSHTVKTFPLPRRAPPRSRIDLLRERIQCREERELLLRHAFTKAPYALRTPIYFIFYLASPFSIKVSSSTFNKSNEN